MKLMIDPAKVHTVLPRVMKAAVRLFVAKGIDGTTTKDIANASGVSEGAFYRHFKGKDELAWFIFSTHVNEFTRELGQRVAEGTEGKEKLRIFIRVCFEAFETQRDLFSFLILSEHRELVRFPADYQHPGHTVLAMIREGQAKGDYRDLDPYVGGSMILGAVIRLCVVRLHGGLKEDLRKKTDEVTELLWKILDPKNGAKEKRENLDSFPRF